MSELYSSVMFRISTLPFHYYNREVDFSSKIFDFGLFIASNSLWEETRKNISKTNKIDSNLYLSSLKYWIRSSSRATPFGAFSGTFFVSISDKTDIRIGEIKKDSVKIRLDMHFLFNLIEEFIKVFNLKEHLDYQINNSLYYIYDAIRYAEYNPYSFISNYELSSIPNTSFISKTIDYLKGGKKNYKQLVFFVKEEFEVEDIDAKTFVNNLIEFQIISNELIPESTGIDPLQNLIDKLNSYLTKSELIMETLSFFISLKNRIDHPEIDSEYLLRIKDSIYNHFEGLSKNKNIFQVNLHPNPDSSCIDKAIINRIISQIDELNPLFGNHYLVDLIRLKERFEKRFENMEIPLVEALDLDLGVGYSFSSDQGSGSHDFIKGLDYKTIGESNGFKNISITEEFLLNKLLSCTNDDVQNIAITEKDLQYLNTIKGNIYKNSDKYIFGKLLSHRGLFNKDNFTFELCSVSGSSAASLMGRFSGLDNSTNSSIQEIINHEESFDSDVIFAEIVHVPYPRVGNVVFRSNFRKFEIPYISKSGMPICNQIYVTDLMVSIRNGEVILRSKKLNKRIIPCLSVAHNFSQGALPIYKFLCDLQLQFKASFSFDWGILSKREFLPQVSYKNIIISVKRWILTKEKIKSILDIRDDIILENLKKWKEEARVSNIVYFKEEDNELLIDFTNDSITLILLKEIKKGKEIILKDCIVNQNNCIVKDSVGNNYLGEIVIPLKKTYSNLINKPSTTNPLEKDKNVVERTFVPGSNWLYFKLYGGNKNLDLLLSDLNDFFSSIVNLDLYRSFFFIRYYDSDYHLRIRFFHEDLEKLKQLKDRFLNFLSNYEKKRILFKIQIDTYIREIERYDPKYIEFSEHLFYADSMAIVEFLLILRGNPEKYRWLFAMRRIDVLLDNFNLSLLSRHELIKSMFENFYKEFGGSKLLLKQLNSLYNMQREVIDSHMEITNDVENQIEEIANILAKETILFGEFLTRFNLTTEQVIDKIPSYTHMFINRLFISDHRKCELYIYHHLERYYYTKIARNKKKQ